MESCLEDSFVGPIFKIFAIHEVLSLLGATSLPRNPGEDRQNLREKDEDFQLGEVMHFAQKCGRIVLEGCAIVDGLLMTCESFESHYHSPMISYHNADSQNLQKSPESLE